MGPGPDREEVGDHDDQRVAIENLEPPTSPTDHLVELEDVGKHYGNIVALSGVSLRVKPREVTCVLGDNGAGKSTLIKIGLRPTRAHPR